MLRGFVILKEAGWAMPCIMDKGSRVFCKPSRRFMSIIAGRGRVLPLGKIQLYTRCPVTRLCLPKGQAALKADPLDRPFASLFHNISVKALRAASLLSFTIF